MTEKELISYASKRHQNLLRLSSKVTSDYLQAHRLDVSQLRSLITQVSTVAFGIVGFSFPLFQDSTLIKTRLLFILGLTLITFCAIYGFWCINIVLQRSVIKAQEGWLKNKDEVGEALEVERFLIKNPDKFEEYEGKRKEVESKLKAQETPKIQMDNFLHLLIGLLTLGVLFLFLSIFQISIKI